MFLRMNVDYFMKPTLEPNGDIVGSFFFGI